MIIIWGSRLCGKVDGVPGVCHIATHFGHLYYIPLIPLKSVIVWGSTPEGEQVSEFHWSLKSILIAWVRTALYLALIPAMAAVFLAVDQKQWEIVPLLLGGLVPVLLYLTYRLPYIGRASAERATVIAETPDLPDHVRQRLVESIKKMYIAQGDVLPPLPDQDHGFHCE
ncbi:MAG: hypothetical protein DWH91_01110 [Planctomycetota bacterium]|nr:MAG: hypothetical protein DWH91_01110 [Planctomycetota bacterium]